MLSKISSHPTRRLSMGEHFYLAASQMLMQRCRC